MHKETATVSVDGTESWTLENSNTDTKLYKNTTIMSNAAQVQSVTEGSLYCPLFSVYNLYNSQYTKEGVGAYSTVLYFRINRSRPSADTTAGFTSWLSTNTPTLYYRLATPTDTKITDSTLIGQLDALYNAKTYLGTTAFLTTATGTNLPVILDIVAYRKSLAGMLGAIERLSE